MPHNGVTNKHELVRVKDRLESNTVESKDIAGEWLPRVMEQLPLRKIVVVICAQEAFMKELVRRGFEERHSFKIHARVYQWLVIERGVCGMAVATPQSTSVKRRKVS